MRRHYFPGLRMCKTTGILILSLLAALKIVISQETKTIRSAEAKKEDADLLDPVSWQEALPIVLFETNDRQLLLYPTALEKASIRNGRLVTGTEFIKPTEPQVGFRPAPPPSQTFFCPSADPEDKCLVPKQFGQSEVLKCDSEPVPVIEQMHRTRKCGVSGNGTMMRFDFKICEPKEPFQFRSRNIAPYSFCYDIPAKKILYVDYNISSVNLIFEKLLAREREIESELNQTTNEIIGSQYFTYLDNLIKTKPQYQFQRLVPTDNMALATWRKITYQYTNVALQHGKLFKLWDDINSYIRTDALESNRSPRRILTGVFDIPHGRFHTSIDKDQMNDIWITIVVNMNEDPMNGKIVLTPTEGIAILMNNYIQSTQTSNQQYSYINAICGENFCVDTLTNRFHEVGGEVRCCRPTKQIFRYFWSDEDRIPEVKLLKIRDITFRRPPV